MASLLFLLADLAELRGVLAGATAVTAAADAVADDGNEFARCAGGSVGVLRVSLRTESETTEAVAEGAADDAEAGAILGATAVAAAPPLTLRG